MFIVNAKIKKAQNKNYLVAEVILEAMPMIAAEMKKPINIPLRSICNWFEATSSPQYLSPIRHIQAYVLKNCKNSKGSTARWATKESGSIITEITFL